MGLPPTPSAFSFKRTAARFQLKPRGIQTPSTNLTSLTNLCAVAVRWGHEDALRAIVERGGRDARARGAERRRGRGGGAVEQGQDRRHPRVVVDAKRGRYPPAERGRRASLPPPWEPSSPEAPCAVCPMFWRARRGRSIASRAGRARLFTPRASSWSRPRTGGGDDRRCRGTRRFTPRATRQRRPDARHKTRGGRRRGLGLCVPRPTPLARPQQPSACGTTSSAVVKAPLPPPPRPPWRRRAARAIAGIAHGFGPPGLHRRQARTSPRGSRGRRQARRRRLCLGVPQKAQSAGGRAHFRRACLRGGARVRREGPPSHSCAPPWPVAAAVSSEDDEWWLQPDARHPPLPVREAKAAAGSPPRGERAELPKLPPRRRGGAMRAAEASFELSAWLRRRSSLAAGLARHGV